MRHLCTEALAERTLTGKRAAALRQQADALAAPAAGGGAPPTAGTAAQQRRVEVLRRQAESLLATAVQEVLDDVQVRWPHVRCGFRACAVHSMHSVNGTELMRRRTADGKRRSTRSCVLGCLGRTGLTRSARRLAYWHVCPRWLTARSNAPPRRRTPADEEASEHVGRLVP